MDPSPDKTLLTRPMRVLTANIYNYEADYARRGPVLRDAVRALDADVMAFQEAGWRREPGGMHQVEELLAGLGYHIHHQFDGQSAAPTNNGNCIASRWPMTECELLMLPVTPRAAGYPYAALAAVIHAPLLIGDFRFICNKPAWRLDHELERETQAVALAEFAQRMGRGGGDFPTVIAGDFDAAPDSASIRFLTGRQSLGGTSTHYLDAWEAAGDGSGGETWVYDNPLAAALAARVVPQPIHRRRIDYILMASPMLSRRAARFVSCRVALNVAVEGVWPSDHFGVLAEIEGV